MRHRRLLAVVSTVAVAIGTAAALPIASGTANAAGTTTRTVTKVKGGYLTRTKFADGSVMQVYGATPFHTTVPMTRRVQMATNTAGTETTTVSEGGFTVTPDYDISKTAIDAATPSAVEELEAMGVSTEDAAQFAVLGTPDGTASTTPANVTTTRTKITAAVAATTSYYGFPRTDCVDYNFDGTKGHYHGCDTQYAAHEYSGGDWYLADKFLASASMHDYAIFNPDELTGVEIGISYGAYNVIQHWQPTNSYKVGSCTTRSVTLSIAGQSYTTSGTVCPEQEGLEYLSNTTFRTKWNGFGNGPSDGSRSSWGEAGVHSPSNASASRGIFAYYWFD